MRRSFCFVFPLLVMLAAGCTNPPSQQLNKDASADALPTIKPLLDDVAKAHPEQAPQVKDLEDGWTARTERQDYQAAKPLLKIAEQDQPSLAPSIEDTLWSWDKRLTSMGQ